MNVEQRRGRDHPEETSDRHHRTAATTDLTIRPGIRGRRDELGRLAALDSARPPAGPVLVAEAGGAHASPRSPSSPAPPSPTRSPHRPPRRAAAPATRDVRRTRAVLPPPRMAALRVRARTRPARPPRDVNHSLLGITFAEAHSEAAARPAARAGPRLCGRRRRPSRLARHARRPTSAGTTASGCPLRARRARRGARAARRGLRAADHRAARPPPRPAVVERAGARAPRRARPRRRARRRACATRRGRAARRARRRPRHRRRQGARRRRRRRAASPAIPTTLSAAEMTRAAPPRRAASPAETPRVRAGDRPQRPGAVAPRSPSAELAASAPTRSATRSRRRSPPLANPVATLAAHEARAADSPARSRGDEPDRDALALGALLSGYAIGSAVYGLHHVLSQTARARGRRRPRPGQRGAAAPHDRARSRGASRAARGDRDASARTPPAPRRGSPSAPGGAGCATSASTAERAAPAAPTRPPSARELGADAAARGPRRAARALRSGLVARPRAARAASTPARRRPMRRVEQRVHDGGVELRAGAVAQLGAARRRAAAPSR